jgi:hypothetical protein
MLANADIKNDSIQPKTCFRNCKRKSRISPRLHLHRRVAAAFKEQPPSTIG